MLQIFLDQLVFNFIRYKGLSFSSFFAGVFRQLVAVLLHLYRVYSLFFLISYLVVISAFICLYLLLSALICSYLLLSAFIFLYLLLCRSIRIPYPVSRISHLLLSAFICFYLLLSALICSYLLLSALICLYLL